MKRFLTLVLLGLFWFSPAYSLYAAGAYPIVIQKKTASSTGTLATPTYDLATLTISNPFHVQPVEIIGTPSVAVIGTPTVSVDGLVSVLVTGTPTIAMDPWSLNSAVNLTSATVSTLITPLANRKSVMVTNTSLTETVWLNLGATATVSSGLPLTPGSAYIGPWDDSVPIAVISSTSVVLSVIQGG